MGPQKQDGVDGLVRSGFGPIKSSLRDMFVRYMRNPVIIDL